MAKPAQAAQAGMGARPNFIPQKDINVPMSDDVRFPQLKLIQAISPEKTKGDEKFVPGIEEGNLLLKGDSVQRIIDGDEGIQLIPLVVRKRYAEYIPRTKGGGFVASYDTKEEADAKATAGNDLQVTYEFLCIEANADEPTPFVVTFDSPTKLGVAKKWAGYFAQYKTIDGVIYRLTSKQAKNKANQAYYNFAIIPVGWVDKGQYQFVQQLTGTVEPLFLPLHSSEM